MQKRRRSTLESLGGVSHARRCRARDSPHIEVSRPGTAGKDIFGSAVPMQRSPAMFLFFSNRLGCGGSLLVSLVITAILLVIFVF